MQTSVLLTQFQFNLVPKIKMPHTPLHSASATTSHSLTRLECIYLSNTTIVALDKYIQSNPVYYKHNGDDELYAYSLIQNKQS